MAEERFHLLLSPGSVIDPAAAARALAPRLGIRPSDLAIRLRSGGGWLLRDLDASVAGGLEAIIRESFGVELLRVPDDCPLTRPVVRRARSVRFHEDTLELTFPESEESFALDDFVLVLAVVLGELRDLTPDGESVHPWRGVLSTNQQWKKVREALTDERLRIRFAGIYLVVPEPIEFLRVELGTPFPELALIDEMNTLDNWLGLYCHLMDRLPESRVTPETRTFWRDADLEAILIEKREEHDNRLLWIAELLARGLWKGTA